MCATTLLEVGLGGDGRGTFPIIVCVERVVGCSTVAENTRRGVDNYYVVRGGADGEKLEE